MSQTAEVLIKYDGTLEELKAVVESVLGLLFADYERVSELRRAYHGKLLTYDVELSDNYLENDRDLNFEDFPYLLGIRVAGQLCAGRLREQLSPVTDMTGELLSCYLSVETMVTVDVQELKARYRPR
jgi:hypothetical protein